MSAPSRRFRAACSSRPSVCLLALVHTVQTKTIGLEQLERDSLFGTANNSLPSKLNSPLVTFNEGNSFSSSSTNAEMLKCIVLFLDVTWLDLLVDQIHDRKRSNHDIHALNSSTPTPHFDCRKPGAGLVAGLKRAMRRFFG